MLTSLHQSILDHLATALRPLLLPGTAGQITVDDEAPRDLDTLRIRIVTVVDSCTRRFRLTSPSLERVLWRGPDFEVTHLIEAGDSDASAAVVIKRRLQAALDRGRNRAPMANALTALALFRTFRVVPPAEWATCDSRELLLRLQFGCNQDCSFCWQGRQWPNPPVDLLHQWIDEAAAAGVSQLVLSGGEPTLHAELLLLVAHGKHHGMAVSLQTNAIRLANQPELLANVVAAGVDAAVISHHSHDAALSDAMTRAPGTHRRTEAGIIACLGAGLQVTLNCVVESRNHRTLPEHAAAIVAKFLPHAKTPLQLAVSYSHPNAPFDRALEREQTASLQAVFAPLTTALTTLHRAGVVALAAGPCGFPLCVQRDDPRWIALLPPSTQQLPGRHRSHACARCALADRCVGPRASYLAQHGEAGLVPFETVPPDLGAALPADARAWWDIGAGVTGQAAGHAADEP